MIAERIDTLVPAREEQEKISPSLRLRRLMSVLPNDPCGNNLELYMRQINRVPLLTPEEKIKYGRQNREAREQGRKDEEAHAMLTLPNLRLVPWFAHKYKGRGLELGDLIQEGNLGLLHAIDKFDERIGTQLSTYAGWWIRQAMQRGIDDTSGTIRIPVGTLEDVRSHLRANGIATQQLQREPTPEEMSKVSKLSRKQITMIDELQNPVSLETPINGTDDILLEDQIEDKDENTGKAAEVNQRKEDIRNALGTLNPRERMVMILRFGLEDDTELSLREIGGVLGVTRERARQIEAEAIKKLRHPNVTGILRDYLD